VLDALQPTDDDARTGLSMLLRAADRLAMGRCLIGAGRLPADATWPVGLPGYAAIEPRDALFAAMSRELEAGAEAAGTAA
jgi:hypothetical protein